MSPCALAYHSEITGRKQTQQLGLDGKVNITCMFLHLLKDAFHGGIIIVSGPSKGVYPPTVPKLSRMVELASG